MFQVHAPLRGAALLEVFVLFVASWIHPAWPVEQALHSSLTVVALAFLVRYTRRPGTRDADFVLLCAFLALHIIAARWLYSNVPYDAWFREAFGFSPQATFGWQRNHFDRLVHLAYGLCLAPATAHYLRGRYPLSPRHAFAITLLLVMASSLVYEWLEWGIALTMSPHDAEAYNGQQGDMWDAHADMLLATLGTLATAPWLARAVKGGPR